MITAANLKTLTLKDLNEMAKKNGISGTSSMRKDDLVKVLVRTLKKSSKPAANGKKATKKVAKKATASRNGKPTKATKTTKSTKKTVVARGAKKVTAKKASKKPAAAKKTPVKTSSKKAAVKGKGSPKKPAPAKKVNKTVTRRLKRFNDKMEKGKDLSAPALKPAPLSPGRKSKDRLPQGKDRIVLLVLDPFWLQAYWEVTRQSVERAQAAMAESWHSARPILRLYEVETGSTTSTTESVARQIEIHGGVKNWYIDVKDPPKSYRVELGYLAANGRFFSLCRSNTVNTPSPGSSDALDRNWSDVAENYEKIYAMSGGYSNEPDSKELQELFEERLRRPMGAPVVTRYGAGADTGAGRERDFRFDVDAEMIIYGSTKPDAHVTLSGEPVRLRPDGTFTVRLSMPDKRQVIPAVAASGDGVEQRTIVLAVERNTKVMEPMIRENSP